ncbi:hypothetical protein D3C79_700380 [compost metagenome]
MGCTIIGSEIGCVYGFLSVILPYWFCWKAAWSSSWRRGRLNNLRKQGVLRLKPAFLGRCHVLAYDRRHGYRGPEARLSKLGRDGWLERLQPEHVTGGLAPAIVTGISDVDVTVLNRNGEENTCRLGHDEVGATVCQC